MESLWADVVESHSPQTIEFVGTLAVQVLAFWVPCICYLLFDLLCPSLSQKHKIQPPPKQPSYAAIRQCFRVVARNQLLSSVLHVSQLYVKGTSYAISPTLPSLAEVLPHFVVSLFLREALFYYSHRLLHYPPLYRRIHKRHHQFTAPIALAAQYAHPIEQIVANALPITLPPQILGSHVVTFWVFLAYELANTAAVHSGYDFGGLAKMHDLHHEKFNLNYGSVGLLDWVHGTNRLRGEKVE